MEEVDYRPEKIEFDANSNSNFPETFGIFETENSMREFMENMVGFNMKLATLRKMDDYEKKELRKDYGEYLEVLLPAHGTNLKEATAILEDAKEKYKEAKDAVEYAKNMAIQIAYEVRQGTKEINLDDKYTYRIPFEDRYYFVTWINQELKLCKVQIIPDHEKSDLWNSLSKNEIFINNNFPK